MNNLTENNKLIAEFLGYKQPHPDYPTSTYWYKEWQEPLTILSFNKDWNWLMLVVENIESKGFDVFINTCVCRISDVGEDRFEDIETFNSTSKIQAVYQAVVEFIKWYNNQTK